ncbi:hypothetical protein [Filimonas effusa]|uniref:Uncharacterized protein n=1 Tax=Filimonas effusa TaxID=2508721 RepID=A0A4V1M9X2_9BACT|nr:hypothetical protein [Filimonas effusa]RXK83164.1 hypothetical protein ESB13_13680 [Filimonas effusa]
MGRTQNFFEYQKMLADEYAGLDPRRLLYLCAILTGHEIAAVDHALASPKYAVFRELFTLAHKVIACAGEDVEGPVIDQCQRDLSEACRKFSRKSKFPDADKQSLSACAEKLLYFIHYLKTEDPLYLLHTLEQMQTLDTATLAAYGDQLILLSRLKSFLKL